MPPISKHGEKWGPQKSPYNFERFDSGLEERMMDKLDADPTVVKWMKRHGISISWVDSQKHMRRYVPDFIVRLQSAASVHLILETKGYDPLEEVKAQAARRWVEAVNVDGRYGRWYYAVARAPEEVWKCIEETMAAMPSA